VVQPLGHLAHQCDGRSRGSATVSLLFALVPSVGDGILLNPTENGEPQELAHARWTALGDFDLAMHRAAALLFEIEAHGFQKSACTGKRPCITDLGEDGSSGGVTDDWGKGGSGRGSGELVDLGLGRGEGTVGAVGVIGEPRALALAPRPA